MNAAQQEDKFLVPCEKKSGVFQKKKKKIV